MSNKIHFFVSLLLFLSLYFSLSLALDLCNHISVLMYSDLSRIFSFCMSNCLHLIYIVSYYIEDVKASWTYSTIVKPLLRFFLTSALFKDMVLLIVNFFGATQLMVTGSGV